MVASGALAMDIVDGQGDLRHIERNDSEEWLAASTSLGLLGIIARIKLKIYPDTKVYAKQDMQVFSVSGRQCQHTCPGGISH